MATQSRVQWDNGDPWDDQSLLLTAIVINNTNGIYPLPCKATVLANDRTREVTVAPGASIQINIPTNQANRFELNINPTNGRLDGVDWQVG